jgi:FkbH-like protein
MLLKRDQIVSHRINWSPKSENIKSLAEELKIGLDSFIFLDDNPLECAEVQANCPDVLTLRLPDDAASASTFLNHVWMLDSIGQSAEARRRTDLYKNNAQRDRLRNESLTFKEFFDTLDLEVEIAALTSDDIPRVAELTQRTNQFNIAPIRRSESEVRDLCKSGGAECLIVRARDRFGDYGLVGVIIVNAAEGKLRADTFLLSCRALGRGVEHRMLAKLGQMASERNLNAIEIPYHPTAKNRPALAFLDSVGTPFKEQSGDDYLFTFPSEFAMGVTFTADAMDRTSDLAEHSLSSHETGVPNNAPKADLWGLIAEEMHDIEQIHSIVSAQRKMQSTSAVAYVAPRMPIEQRLAAIYSEVLGIDQIGVYDNFFDLGGHSLLAMQVLSRVREAFQVEIPIGVLFTSEFTINDLAQEIGKNRIQQADPDQLDRVLQHLDSLSDDDVKRILASSRQPYPEREPE